MRQIAIRNNVVAMVAHMTMSYILLGVMTLISRGYFTTLGMFWLEAVEMEGLLYTSIIAVIHTVIVFALYFWAGKKFLCDTGNVLANACSVLAIPVVITVIALVTWFAPSVQDVVIWFLTFSSSIQGGVIAYLFCMGSAYGHPYSTSIFALVLSTLFLALAMWLGLNRTSN